MAHETEPWDLTKLTDEELAQLERLRERARPDATRGEVLSPGTASTVTSREVRD